MGLPNGLHHIAICTKDIKGQIEFYSQVVGMELVALYWMHGVQKTFHGFLKMGNASIAFVQSPEIGEIQPQKGVSHPSWTAAPVAAGVMQHPCSQPRRRGRVTRDPRPRALAWVLGDGPYRSRLLQIDLPGCAGRYHARILHLRG
jgi:catechol 2,3-dioxygenase-like lactoylglutathione lyase family enzyme